MNSKSNNKNKNNIRIKTLLKQMAALLVCCLLSLVFAGSAFAGETDGQTEVLLQDETEVQEIFFLQEDHTVELMEQPLSEREAAIYEVLKEMAAETAAGTRLSTYYAISMQEQGWDISYTAESEEDAREGAIDILNLDTSLIVHRLMYTCPFELYWMDSSERTPVSISLQREQTGELYSVRVQSVNFSFPVSGDFAESTYKIDQEKTEAATAALEKAAQIVEKYKDVSDFEKLTGYKNEICALTDYNTQAAGGGIAYGNPWQMLWVFDEDPSTTVVCEGYAKAFQYLCDQTDFEGTVSSHLVSGFLEGTIITPIATTTGTMEHMWNVVELEGSVYLADVTNCDQGMVGEDGCLFLAGTYEFVGVEAFEQGFPIMARTTDLIYLYDDDTISCYPESALFLNFGSHSDTPWYESYQYEEGGLVYQIRASHAELTGCQTDLHELTIPKTVNGANVESIADGALDVCSNLQILTIPKTVTQIGEDALTGLKHLEWIFVEDNNPVYRGHRGALCKKDSGKNKWRLILFPAGRSEERFVLPDYVTIVEGSGFLGYADVVEVVTQNTDLRDPGLIPCREFQVWKNNTAYCSVDGLLYSKDGTTLLAIPREKEGAVQVKEGTDVIACNCAGAAFSSIILPDSVISMNWKCFRDQKNLKDVTFGDQLSVISEEAFYGCSNLEQVQLPNVLCEIKESAFEGCRNLKEIDLPDSIQYIQGWAFYQTGIQTLHLPEELKVINGRLFGSDDETGKKVYFRSDAPILMDDGLFAGTTGLQAFYPKGKSGWTADRLQQYGGINVSWQSYVMENAEARHTYTYLGWEWSEDYRQADVVFIVDGNADVPERFPAEVWVEERLPTCEHGGSRQYYATLVLDGNVYTDFKQESLAALAHTPGDMGIEDYVEPTVFRTGSYAEVVRCSVCNTVLSKHVVTIPRLIAAPSEITLNKEQAELATLTSVSLTAEAKPAEAMKRNIVWTSSNPDVASVDENGVITAHKYGTAVIRAASEADSAVFAECKVQTRYYDAFYRLDGTDRSNVTEETADAIYWAADHKITGETVRFKTNDSLTRGQFVRFLYRYAGNPKVTKAMAKNYGGKFNDIDASYTHYKAIVWAASKGLIDGYSDGTFRPQKSLTRKNVATILWKFAGSPKVTDVKNPFDDVAKSAAIAWGKKNGIFTGNKFLPKTNCLRGEFALFLYRFDQK